MDGFLDDLNLIFENAMLFNKSGTKVHEDARKMKEKAHQIVEEILATCDTETKQKMYGTDQVETGKFLSYCSIMQYYNHLVTLYTVYLNADSFKRDLL